MLSCDAPIIRLPIAWLAAASFSVTMRLASARAFGPPFASFIRRSPMTCCDSAASIVRLNQDLYIERLQLRGARSPHAAPHNDYNHSRFHVTREASLGGRLGRTQPPHGDQSRTIFE